MKNIIYPTIKENVMDLLKLAGVDVSDWVNFEGKNPATNPKYCYDWSFVEPGKVVVLNLWYEDIIEEDDTLYLKDNFKEHAKYFSNTFKKPIWAGRALKMDKAVQTALKDNLIVRAIICRGETRRRKVSEPEASKVEGRILDPVPWSISNYNANTGDCTITRGVKKIKTYDQFDLIFPSESSKHNKKKVSANVYNRSPIVRNKVLSRANYCCEYCGEIGFLTKDEGHFLETHHIISLSENGNDDELNVIALCPNHHRIAHYGKDKLLIQDELKKKIKEMYRKRK